MNWWKESLPSPILNGLSVVAFRGEETQWGPTWDVFVSERQQTSQQTQRKPSQAALDLFQKPLDRR